VLAFGLSPDEKYGADKQIKNLSGGMH